MPGLNKEDFVKQYLISLSGSALLLTGCLDFGALDGLELDMDGLEDFEIGASELDASGDAKEGGGTSGFQDGDTSNDFLIVLGKVDADEAEEEFEAGFQIETSEQPEGDEEYDLGQETVKGIYTDHEGVSYLATNGELVITDSDENAIQGEFWFDATEIDDGGEPDSQGEEIEIRDGEFDVPVVDEVDHDF